MGGSEIDGAVAHIHIGDVERTERGFREDRIDESFRHASLSEHVSAIEVGSFGILRLEGCDHLLRHDGVVFEGEVPPVISAEGIPLLFGHRIVPVEEIAIDPLIRRPGIQCEEVPTVPRCGGTLQGLDDEFLVVHVDLIREPSAVRLTAQGHVVLDRGCSLYDDDLGSHRAVLLLHAERYRPLLTDLMILRSRDHVQEAEVVEDAVLLDGPHRPA